MSNQTHHQITTPPDLHAVIADAHRLRRARNTYLINAGVAYLRGVFTARRTANKASV